MVVDIESTVDEAGQASDHRYHNTHGMGVELETLVEIQDLLVNMHLLLNSDSELSQIFSHWLLAVQKNEADLDIGALLNKILDVVASVVQVAFLGNVSNGRHATSGDRVAWVVAEEGGFSVHSLDINELVAVVSLEDWQFELLVFTFFVLVMESDKVLGLWDRRLDVRVLVLGQAALHVHIIFKLGHERLYALMALLGISNIEKLLLLLLSDAVRLLHESLGQLLGGDEGGFFLHFLLDFA
mmetsp:Transcript_33069/g.50730  ORF Transcript_33069/g.50730 Transcript_33069/m.50730 type:complete len:241 (-) Transcript_33069:39-761(-)